MGENVIPQESTAHHEAMHASRSNNVGRPVWERKGMTEEEYIGAKYDQLQKITGILIDSATQGAQSDDTSQETGLSITATKDSRNGQNRLRIQNKISGVDVQISQSPESIRVSKHISNNRVGVEARRFSNGRSSLEDAYGTLAPNRKDTAANVTNAARLVKEAKEKIQTNNNVASRRGSQLLDLK